MARWPDTLDVFDRAAETVLEHTFGAGLSTQPVVVCKFQAFLTLVIDARKSHQVAGDLTRRIVTPIFAYDVDTR